MHNSQIIQEDAAQLAKLLDDNKTAGLMLAKWLAKIDLRATDCYVEECKKHYVLQAEKLSLFSSNTMHHYLKQLHRKYSFFKKWKFWIAIAHPINITFATFEQKVVLQETNNLEDGFRSLITYEPVKIILEEQAIDYIYFFLSFSVTSAEIISPANIEEFSVLNNKNKQQWEQIIKQISHPSAQRDGKNYRVFLWLVKDTNVYQATFKIDEQGTVSSSLTLIASEMVYSTFDSAIE